MRQLNNNKLELKQNNFDFIKIQFINLNFIDVFVSDNMHMSYSGGKKVSAIS